jgi:hypothetical protein
LGRRIAPYVVGFALAACTAEPVDPPVVDVERDAGPEVIAQLLPLHRCRTPEVTTPFVDVSSCTHVEARRGYDDNYQTSGQAFADIDNDGWLDLYVTDTTGPNTLYGNNGDGTFSIARQHPAVSGHYASGGAVFADYNNDGYADLYVLNFGANALYRNDRGVRFVDVTATAGVGDPGKSQTAAWGDYDNDGFIDLYVTNWACPECDGDPLVTSRDTLYHNEGNGTFTDVSHLLGGIELSGAGFVTSFLDFDDDGDLDLYVVNDKGYPGPREEGGPMNRNLLFVNEGEGCGGWCFVDRAVEAGADLANDGMGLAITDYDDDGDLDMFVTDIGPPHFLENQGDGTFVDVTERTKTGYDHESWGTVFLDYDNDGRQDLYFALGIAFGFESPNRLFWNAGDGTFEDVSDTSGASDAAYTIGVASGDYDNDGAVDLVIGNWARGYRLLRNLATEQNDHAWITLKMVGGGFVNRDAIGTRVTVVTSDGRRLTQEVKSGSSNGSGNDMRLHFGLGDAAIDHLEIRWPDGLRQTVEDVEPRQRLTLPYPG